MAAVIHPISESSLLFLCILSVRYVAFFVLAVSEATSLDVPLVAKLALAVEIGTTSSIVFACENLVVLVGSELEFIELIGILDFSLLIIFLSLSKESASTSTTIAGDVIAGIVIGSWLFRVELGWEGETDSLEFDGSDERVKVEVRVIYIFPVCAHHAIIAESLALKVHAIKDFGKDLVVCGAHLFDLNFASLDLVGCIDPAECEFAVFTEDDL